MAIRTIRIAAVLLGMISLAGCASMGTSNISVSSVTTPLVVAPEQSLPRIGAPTEIPEGSDFSTAVAMLAKTEGTGIVAVNPGKPTQALALASEPRKPLKKRPTKRPSAKHSAPATVIHEAAITPRPAPKPVCTADSTDPRCPPITPWGQPVVPVKRF